MPARLWVRAVGHSLACQHVCQAAPRMLQSAANLLAELLCGGRGKSLLGCSQMFWKAWQSYQHAGINGRYLVSVAGDQR
jgi:predicted metal-binding protein